MGETPPEITAAEADEILTEEQAANLGHRSPEELGRRLREIADEEERKAEEEPEQEPAAEPTSDLPQDPYAQRCDTCQGGGEVYTGSLREEFAFRPCRDCEGRGFKEVVPEIKVEPLPDYSGTRY